MAAERLLHEALRYAQRGWPVFPCHSLRGGRCSCPRALCKDSGKHPRTEHGLKDATTDAAAIRAWWSSWPDANVGLRTGLPSCVDVLDVDARHGGLDALARLEAENAPLPSSWRARTGSGGLHIYLWHEPGMRNSTGKIGPGLDVRGDGGYVLLPPSLHLSGGRYQWINRPDETALAAWPAWLARLALPSARHDGGACGRVAGDPLPVPSGLRRYAERGAREGERNECALWLACRLVQECSATAEAREVLATFGQACRPPLDKAELDRVWANAQRLQPFSPRTPLYATVDLATGERCIHRSQLRTRFQSRGPWRTRTAEERCDV